MGKYRFPLHHWDDYTNQRNFFEQIAPQLNIRSPKDWYNVSRKDILSKGGAGLLQRYNDSLSKALISIFPEANLSYYQFYRVPYHI